MEANSDNALGFLARICVSNLRKVVIESYFVSDITLILLLVIKIFKFQKILEDIASFLSDDGTVAFLFNREYDKFQHKSINFKEKVSIL